MQETPETPARMSLAVLQRRVITLHKAGRTDEAWSLASASRGQYRQTAMWALWFAELHWRLAYDPEAALQVLVRAREEGDWWARELLRAQQFLLPWEGRPDFEELMAECEEMRAIAQAEVGPAPPQVYLPQRAPRGLLLVLHGRTGRLPNSARPWEPAAKDTGMVVATPRGGQLSSSDGTYDWPDPVDALADVVRDHAALVDEHRLHGLPLVVAGFSRGARLAMGWSLAGHFGARGFIALCPVMRNRPEIMPYIPVAAARGTRGVVLAGEWDWARDGTMAVAEDLRRSGLNVRSYIMKGVDHGYPDDFSERLATALAFVTGRPERPR